MSVKAFFDTNVVLYLLSGEQEKADRAEALIAEGGTISVQVLNEFAATARRKLKMSWTEIAEVLDTVRAICPVQPLTVETHDKGRLLAERYGFALYDSMIVASALLADCTILYSEDMQHGQVVDARLTVQNPFLSA